MTNELAIRILTGDVLATASQTSEAIKTAVKALSMPSAQPENAQINARKTHACDTISRQAAIDAVNELTKWYLETYHEARPTTIAVIDRLLELPSEQPERKRGKWIHGKEICRQYIGLVLMYVRYSHWECSVCGYRTENEPLWNFCPHCGADMRGDSDETD